MLKKTQDGRKATKRELVYASKLLDNLFKLQSNLKSDWIDASLPQGWAHVEHDPVAPSKTRITIALDTEMVRFFRKLGPGYQKRINLILRIYFDALRAGKIRANPEIEEFGPDYLKKLLDMTDIAAQVQTLEQLVKDGEMSISGKSKDAGTSPSG